MTDPTRHAFQPSLEHPDDCALCMMSLKAACHQSVPAAAVEALRERVAELLLTNGELANWTTDVIDRDCAVEARAVELAGALDGLLDSVRAHNEANGREMVDPHATRAAAEAITSTPTKALERARAKDEIIDVAREIVSTESAWTSEWVAKDRLLHNLFARLDALQPDKETAGT